MFKALPPQIVFQEVPDEVSLAFTITGCPLRCQGCHSQETWNRELGLALTPSLFENYLLQYQAMITCVLFFGGEWNSECLVQRLQMAKVHGLKTCLYTGLERVPQRISRHLDYLKIGPWLTEKGGLNESTTNQRLINLHTGQCLNYRFLPNHLNNKNRESLCSV